MVNSQPSLSQVLVKEDNGQKIFYIYGLGLIGQEINGEYLSYHYDFRGSTVALTDKDAQVVERYQYSPYGVLLGGDTSKTPFLFNGMYGVMSDGNGFYYMRARFYSPEIRRFVNRDVLLGKVAEGQSLNRFAFVNGQPVNFTDPFGLAKYCGSCVGNNYDCLLYGGNLCPTEPTSIENFADGFTSYFRAYMRGARHGLRRGGFAGTCERKFAELEGEVLSQLVDEFANNPDFRDAIADQALETLDEKKAAIAGRIFANMLATKAILRGKGGYKATLPIGAALSAGAAISDVRYYIEVSVKANKEIDNSELIEIMLSGEAGNFVKYYDVGCACEN